MSDDRLYEVWDKWEVGDIPSTKKLKQMYEQVKVVVEYLFIRKEHFGWLVYIENRNLLYKLEDLLKMRGVEI